MTPEHIRLKLAAARVAEARSLAAYYPKERALEEARTEWHAANARYVEARANRVRWEELLENKTRKVVVSDG